MFKVIVFVIISTQLIGALHAEAARDQTGRRELIRHALESNLSIKAARLEVERAQALTIDAGALPNPELSISGNSARVLSSSNEYGWSVGVAQAFPITGRLRLLKGVSQQEVRLAQAEVREAELMLGAEVSRVYDELLALERKRSLLDKQLQLVNNFKKQLESAVGKAEASVLDFNQITVAAAIIEQQTDGLDSKEAALWMKLEQLVPTMGKARFAAIPEELPEALAAYDKAQLENHPQYGKQVLLYELGRKQSALAAANRWADITVEIFYEQERAMDSPNGYESERLVGLGISIPLPLHNRNESGIKSSRIRESQMQYLIEHTEREILLKAESLRTRYANVQRQIKGYETAVLVPARANLEMLNAAYADGIADPVAVFRAHEQLLNAGEALLELEAELQSIHTEWDWATAQYPVFEINN